jgi:hypothetical protein
VALRFHLVDAPGNSSLHSLHGAHNKQAPAASVARHHDSVIKTWAEYGSPALKRDLPFLARDLRFPHHSHRRHPRG